MTIKLSYPQNVFLNGLSTKNTAYVGGFGSGKTFVACLKILIYIGRFPKKTWGFWAPSFPLIRDVFYPTFEEAAALMGFRIDINVGNKEVHVYRGSVYYGTVICRSMSNPSSIVGYKVAGGICDEIDTMQKAKAYDAWRKVNARLRLSVKGLEQNWLGVTTTPEGFNFVYETFAKEPKSRYSMVQASTYENREFLPDDYIENLFETYPSNLIEAYLNGEFVNLVGQNVYNEYDPKLNSSDEVVTDADTVLHIGMDFNVTQMAARVFVKRDNGEHIADEFNALYDTKDMIEHIKLRYPDKRIVVYPDSSGKNRKSNGADVTDISLLQQAGFAVVMDDANPRVKTRVNCVNAMFCNANGVRRLFVNKVKCPITHEELSQQVYDDKGEPDKKSGKDHGNDAVGYYIAKMYPIVKQTIHRPKTSYGY